MAKKVKVKQTLSDAIEGTKKMYRPGIPSLSPISGIGSLINDEDMGLKQANEALEMRAQAGIDAIKKKKKPVSPEIMALTKKEKPNMQEIVDMVDAGVGQKYTQKRKVSVKKK
jgi:hypothetical protein